MKKTFALAITGIITVIALSACQQQPSQGQAETITDKPKTIEILTPKANTQVTSPIGITGNATLWFFEGEFPIYLQDQDGNIIAQTQAIPQSDWMTEESIPFTATLEYAKQPAIGTSGKIIFEKANPSGLPEHDESYELDVKF